MSAPPSHPRRRRNQLPPIGTRYTDRLDGTAWTVGQLDRKTGMVQLRHGTTSRWLTTHMLAGGYEEALS